MRGAAMTKTGAGSPQWVVVDEGWGRKAADFATLSEPANCREYVAVHHRLGVDAEDRLLDVACGSGLAIELARLRGASCAGIDASARLVAVARDRNPDCDIRTGDMHALPWDRASFDVVTSVRRILGAGTVRPSRGGEGGQPGGDGLARPAWCGRATPSVLRIRRYRAHGRPVRLGVRGPGAVRARPGQYRP